MGSVSSGLHVSSAVKMGQRTGRWQASKSNHVDCYKRKRRRGDRSHWVAGPMTRWPCHVAVSLDGVQLSNLLGGGALNVTSLQKITGGTLFASPFARHGHFSPLRQANRQQCPRFIFPVFFWMLLQLMSTSCYDAGKWPRWSVQEAGRQLLTSALLRLKLFSVKLDRSVNQLNWIK
jgi:hypothetical protein